MRPIAAVQPRRQLAVFGGIAVDVGIEQQQIAAADFHAPDLCAECARCASRSRTMTGSPSVPMAGFHRQLVDVGLEIFFLLPAVAIQMLPEIALAVKQADADQRNVEVGGALDVIAGEHAQAAGIDRHRFVQAELGGEIRHRTRPQHAGVSWRPRCGRPRRYSCCRR